MTGVDVLTESAPERIWLQVDADGDAEDRSEPIMRESWGDMTWCAEEIGGQEVAYVRADLAAKLRDALQALLDADDYALETDASLQYEAEQGNGFAPYVIAARAAIREVQP